MLPSKFLPLGSVVMLKGGKKRIMIIGFCGVDSDSKEIIYDYLGCLYPEGVISTDKTLLFNHEQIETVYYVGFSDNEEKRFRDKLVDTIKNIENK